jgi:hypothetical protein
LSGISPNISFLPFSGMQNYCFAAQYMPNIQPVPKNNHGTNWMRLRTLV